MDDERIEGAALRLPNGTMISKAPPARHADVEIEAYLIGYGLAEVERADRGFVTSAGRWVRRVPALRIAHMAGQIKPGVQPKRELYSDDVW